VYLELALFGECFIAISVDEMDTEIISWYVFLQNLVISISEIYNFIKNSKISKQVRGLKS